MTNTPFLSVVIPSYNEMSNIKKDVLDEILDYLKNQSFTWELIFSDDGSTDGTLDFLKDLAHKYSQISVIANSHAGKAPTVKAGMLKATGNWRLYTDFDQSTPISELEKLQKFIDTHQVIIGSREIRGAQRTKEPIHRHIMGKGFNFFVQLLAVPGIYDTQCGFKLFSAQATEDLFNKLYIYGGNNVVKDAYTGAFDVELLFLARKMGYKLKEVPILWKHAASDRVNPLKDSVRMLRDIVRIRIAYLQGKYQFN